MPEIDEEVENLRRKTSCSYSGAVMDALTTDELTELERLAKAATQETPTVVRYDHGGGRVYLERQDGGRELIFDAYDEANREFYVRANPLTIIRLVEMVKERVAANDAQTSALLKAAEKLTTLEAERLAPRQRERR